MTPLLQGTEERSESTIFREALSFFVHTALALGSWGMLMAAGYLLNPPNISQGLVVALSLLVPLAVGLLINRSRQDEMPTAVWLVGLIWILLITLWILDLPTGPNHCLRCDATEKLTRTLFSIPGPSGLIDNDGPFIGTWPPLALFGYSIGARLSLRRQDSST